ncbi:ABC transporter ATP-binding protein [Rhizobium sp. Leaf383]|uniref:ABC transporter ATP-binding protein n=1 Tax=Rhizobium sp. Leaf383 TaxID=1736357 RepID=UPI0007145744|nr:ABC transporter ATP-binding protein [Rhizobium sp. Leaf383]KQS76414.1 hypothetical protein ASG58_11360 [Rhizobium sp. Leaf383]
MVLKVTDLTVEYDGRTENGPAVDRLSLDVGAGEIVAIVGESGSGKSTFGMAIQGLLPSGHAGGVTGSIELCGDEVVGAPGDRLRRLRKSFVRSIPQDILGALDPTMKILGQMGEACEASKPDIAQWLVRVGLTDLARILLSRPGDLSAGQRQRVLAVMALAAKPRLLIADEPTTALDPSNRNLVMDAMSRAVRGTDRAAVVITHDISVAARLADRIAVMYRGQIVEIGETSSVLAGPAHPYTNRLLASRYWLTTDRTRPLPDIRTAADSRERPAAGCVYVTSCSLAGDRCRTTRPQLTHETSTGKQVACFRPGTRRDASDVSAAPWPAILPREEKLIELKDIGFGYPAPRFRFRAGKPPTDVLSGVSMVVREGECVSVIGVSGSGKTTLLKLVAGLLRPSAGTVIRVGDCQVQTVFQDAVSSLTPWLTVGEQIAERLRPLKLPAPDIVCAVERNLEMVGLDPRARSFLPGELSQGQCQRAAIARAVIVPPKLLLCDEPTGSLDVSTAAGILNLLGSLRRELGMAMIFVTHDLPAARIISDRVVVLSAGRIVEDLSPECIGQASAVVGEFDEAGWSERTYGR